MPVFDRVKETTTTTGTGALTLSGPSTGFQAFSSVFSIGDTTFYSIVAEDGSWETGIGTYSSANTLSRTTVLESSNSGNLVGFASGIKTAFVTYPASKSVTIDQSIALSIALG
tara:strand:+ start:187 stop:525 length:339 start_codon:yes stop_codon:yes gene_type:complete